MTNATIATNFSASFGVVAGYGHGNDEVKDDPAVIVARAWREALEAEFAASGILVGATITGGRVVYPASFGCPEDGEVVAVVSGDSNPKFVSGDEALANFKEAVIRVTAATKRALEQARVQLTFSDVSGFVYDEPEDEGGTSRFGL